MTQTTMHLLYDNQTDRYYIDVIFVGPGIDHQVDLASFDTAEEAGAFMSKWGRDRGLTWAPDSSRRLSEAQRLGAVHLALDLIPGKPWREA